MEIEAHWEFCVIGGRSMAWRGGRRMLRMQVSLHLTVPGLGFFPSPHLEQFSIDAVKH